MGFAKGYRDAVKARVFSIIQFGRPVRHSFISAVRAFEISLTTVFRTIRPWMVYTDTSTECACFSRSSGGMELGSGEGAKAGEALAPPKSEANGPSRGVDTGRG